MNRLGLLFNDYAAAFSNRVRETSRDLDINAGLIRFRLFGNDDRKNAAWKASGYGKDDIYFSAVSSNPIEIWGDVREVAAGEHEGQLVINTLSLGHELIHALRVILANWSLANEDEGEPMSPDKYTEI